MMKLTLLLTAFAVSAVAGTANAQTVADIGTNAPTPGVDDVYQLTTGAQANDGLNYYFDSIPVCGQTFTTGNNPNGYVLTSVAIKTDGGGGGNPWISQGYHLWIYSVSNSLATMQSTYTGTMVFTQQDWIQWTGLNTPLGPNRQYAYGLHRDTQGWEQLANLGGNVYAGGEIAQFSTSPGTSPIKFGSTRNSDAVFDIGLAVAQAPAPVAPSYTPNVNPVYAGSVITLNTECYGAQPLSYEWMSDNGTGGSLVPVTGFSAANTNLTVDTSSFTVGNTYAYAYVATNTYGSTTSPTVTLTITNGSSPLIITNVATPDTTTNFVGQAETYAVSAMGTTPIAYQWQYSPNADGSGATNIAGATSATLVLTNLQTSDTGYYSCQASNSVSPYTANSAWTPLTVLPYSEALVQWSAPVAFNGLTAGQILTNVPGNYLEAEAFGSATGPFTVAVGDQTYLFRTDGGSASLTGHQGNTTGSYPTNFTTGDPTFDQVLNDRAYNTTSGTMTITLYNLVIGEQYNVQLFGLDAVNSGRFVSFQDPNNPADISATYDENDLKYLVGTFTAQDTSLTIQLNVYLSTGSTYVGNMDALVVRALSYVPTNAPSFYVQPAPASAYEGRTVQFTAAASGNPIPTYQWQDGSGNDLVNGSQYSGVTSNTLTVANVSTAINGTQYQCVAMNSVGTNASSLATLTVLSAPPSSGTYSTKVLALNPVAYWPLNDTQDPYNGGVAVYDASGNMYDGQYLTNAFNVADGVYGPQPADGYPQFTDGQGAFQPSFSPLGPYPGDWVTLPALNMDTNTVTMCMWVYPDGAQNDATGLLVNRNSGSVGGMNYSTGQRLGYTWNDNDSGTWSYTAGPVIPTNMWSFVAMVIAPNSASFYVINTNGGASTVYNYANNSMPWGGSSANITLGTDLAGTSTRTFNGVIDEAAVFNYDLTVNQLTNMAGISYVPPVNTNAATLNFGVTTSGTPGSQTLNFTWAADHMGWQLYTNSVGLTATNNWFPVPGSANVNQESIGVDPTMTNVFFQMRYP